MRNFPYLLSDKSLWRTVYKYRGGFSFFEIKKKLFSLLPTQKFFPSTIKEKHIHNWTYKLNIFVVIMTNISISCNWNILTILEEGYFSTKMENWDFVWTLLLGFIGIYLICHINIWYNGDANNVFHCSFVFYSFILAGRAYYHNCASIQSKNLIQENVTRWLDGTEGQM